MKKIWGVLIVVLVTLVGYTVIKEYQNNIVIPIKDSNEKFERYEKELKKLAKENDFKFSSHGDCDNESCYKTIILDTDKNFSMAFDFNNYDCSEQLKISIDSNKDDTNIFYLLDYDLIEQVCKIVYNKSFKEKLIQKSNSISKVNKNGEGKIFKLDRKNNITIQYFTDYYYESKGVKSDSYCSRLIISKN